ncbi:glycosyltransferase [Paenibacillus oenotherae]|uniref:Glycosyltransferase n=1 Tax=Paenibacillus oenotherae TaxID=1435645 RepID=A0ABS7D5B4_9BACL|nr:glycosyltransferase [Paenibacillus oenotherae]
MSVIIPTYNAGPALQVLLDRLQQQTLQPCEIIVVDSSSTDGTAELAQQYGARVFTVLQSEFDHGGTRNYAAGLARGDILVFMTQDAIPADSSMLCELTRPLQDERVACSYGRQLARADATILERMMREYNYPEASASKDKSHLPQLGIKTFFCSNVCAAVRKETFVEAGRFPEPVIFNEDLFFAAKCILQGYSVVYAAKAQVIHSHNYSLMAQFRRFFDNGVSMRNNEWVFQYSAVGKEGMSMIRNQLQSLHRQRQWKWMPRLVAESAAKFLGYQLGKRHRQLPNTLCVKFSMHPRIWGKMSMATGGIAEKQG